MTSKARQSRREAARKAQQGDSRSRWFIVAAVAIVVVGAAAAAVVLGGSSGGSSPAISASAGASAAGSGGVAAPIITGESLPRFTGPTGDAAVGLTAPTVQGTSFSGAPVAIEPTGRPKIVIFIAHWCSHCQNEVPVVQDWIDAQGMPEGLDLVSVVTGTDSNRPNYPPEAWLAREGWTLPVIVDPTNSVAEAYGLSAYPFWVFLDGQGKVVFRTSGELSVNDIQAAIDGLTRR